MVLTINPVLVYESHTSRQSLNAGLNINRFEWMKKCLVKTPMMKYMRSM